VKNFLEISSLREARVVRLAVDSINMYGMPQEKFRIPWMALLNSFKLFSLCLSEDIMPHRNTVLEDFLGAKVLLPTSYC